MASARRRQPRRVPPRHLLAVLALSALLSALYYTCLRRPAVVLPPADTRVWPQEPPEIWAGRAAQVKQAFRHAYHGYERHAFPHDELLPVSNGSIDNFNGWGVTAVDSLDTMLLMGLGDEYSRVLPLISQSNFSLSTNKFVPFFETTIRHLGGMLAAYAITGHDLLRDKADDLGSLLALAFNTPNKLPNPIVDTYTRKNISVGKTILAEMASCQLEYAYLGKITGKREHVDHATLITDMLYHADLARTGGMYPTHWDLDAGVPSNRTVRLSVGALADSGHEYTLKQFLLTARTDKRNLEMYLRFTLYVISNLLFITPDRHLLYVTDATILKHALTPSHNLEHLSCFFPGLLALGAHLLPLDRLDALGIDISTLTDGLLPVDRSAYANLLSEFTFAELHRWAAEGIAQTCALTYADQPSGLGPEVVWMAADRDGAIPWVDALRAWNSHDDDHGWWRWWRWPPRQGTRKTGASPPGVGNIRPWTPPPPPDDDGANATVLPLIRSGWGRVKTNPRSTDGRDYYIRDPSYLLRPETIESLYILWKTTGDVKWRHRGWGIFQAIERHTKTVSGYTSVTLVHTASPRPKDAMPSYFLAETLKYLYLLFLDADPVPLETWVFNTEAHALPVFAWTGEEREKYDVV